VRVDDDLLAILQRADVAGRTIVVREPLDRSTYVRVNAAIEGLGGKWSRKDRAHVFPVDVAELLAGMIDSGEYTDRKKSLQFYPTPAALAARMVAEARLCDWSNVLEPSAGTGAIINALPRKIGSLTAVEIDPDNARSLRSAVGEAATPTTIVEGDFLAWAAIAVDRYDAIIMNPPFSNGQDAEHVQAAHRLLAPGGTLVAVLSDGPFYREDRRSAAFRAFLGALPHTTSLLPQDTFRSSGTSVSTRLVTIDSFSIFSGAD